MAESRRRLLMLTVKVVQSRNNVETIYEARQVHRSLDENRKEGDSIIGNVYVDPVELEAGQITYPIRATAPSNGSDDITMFVMNRHGATVGTFHL
jgi:hypothetical protein